MSTEPEGPAEVFNLVSVKMAGGGHNLLTIAQWLELTSSEHVSLILEKRVTFLKGDVIVPVREALAALRAETDRLRKKLFHK